MSASITYSCEVMALQGHWLKGWVSMRTFSAECLGHSTIFGLSPQLHVRMSDVFFVGICVCPMILYSRFVCMSLPWTHVRI